MAKNFARCDTCDLDFTYLDNPICPRCRGNVLSPNELTGLKRASLEIDKIMKKNSPVSGYLSIGIDMGLGLALGVLKTEIEREEVNK